MTNFLSFNLNAHWKPRDYIALDHTTTNALKLIISVHKKKKIIEKIFLIVELCMLAFIPFYDSLKSRDFIIQPVTN